MAYVHLKRQASVKRRIAQYITKAEHLTKMLDTNENDEAKCKQTAEMSTNVFQHLDLFCDIKDLKRYHVQSILENRVILALDGSHEKVVIKVLRKSSNAPTNVNKKRSLLPLNIRFMVKLKRYYENNEELILVLDYIESGA